MSNIKTFDEFCVDAIMSSTDSLMMPKDMDVEKVKYFLIYEMSWVLGSMESAEIEFECILKQQYQTYLENMKVL